ncbi:MAG: TlyA family RNA methyltransferase [Deltaproteobacteria bacterium]|nr:TlyA family RNA methyltransferase [Deltaproteobacteria bacterium]
MASTKERLDILCVQAGLAESRDRARRLILAGQILVDGQRSAKAGTRVPLTAQIALKGEPLPYVSRGGVKLAGALDHFAIDVAGLVGLDVGASTGGFTDCLLVRGARHMICVDVGYGQLAWKLRQDPRVTNIERTNARHLTAEVLRERVPAEVWPPQLAVVDVSFISLTKILPAIAAILAPSSPVVALVKPQFEVGRGELGKGGVVRDPARRQAAIDHVLGWARRAGFTVREGVDSTLPGPKGNVEYLAWLDTPALDGIVAARDEANLSDHPARAGVSSRSSGVPEDER